MLDFLRREGVNSRLIQELADFRKQYPAESGLKDRIRMPRYLYYGTDIWEEALAALLSGEHLLLTGPKATGKNVFAENLAAAFGRPLFNISLSINTDAASTLAQTLSKTGKLFSGKVLSAKAHGLAVSVYWTKLTWPKTKPLPFSMKPLIFVAALTFPDTAARSCTPPPALLQP